MQMLTRLTAFALGLMGLAAAALAQQPYEYTTISVGKEAGSMVEWGIGAAFLVGTLVVVFKPAKRSNLK